MKRLRDSPCRRGPAAIIAFSKDHSALDIDVLDRWRSASGDMMLPRIAHVFGVSKDVFARAVASGEDVPETLTAIMQTITLLNAFERINDLATRKRCLDYVRAAAESDTEAT